MPEERLAKLEQKVDDLKEDIGEIKTTNASIATSIMKLASFDEKFEENTRAHERIHEQIEKLQDTNSNREASFTWLITCQTWVSHVLKGVAVVGVVSVISFLLYLWATHQ